MPMVYCRICWSLFRFPSFLALGWFFCRCCCCVGTKLNLVYWYTPFEQRVFVLLLFVSSVPFFYMYAPVCAHLPLRENHHSHFCRTEMNVFVTNVILPRKLSCMVLPEADKKNPYNLSKLHRKKPDVCWQCHGQHLLSFFLFCFVSSHALSHIFKYIWNDEFKPFDMLDITRHFPPFPSTLAQMTKKKK